LIPTAFENGIFTAVVDNAPNQMKNIKYWDIVQIPMTEVEDWIIRDPDGNFTGNFIYHALND